MPEFIALWKPFVVGFSIPDEKFRRVFFVAWQGLVLLVLLVKIFKPYKEIRSGGLLVFKSSPWGGTGTKFRIPRLWFYVFLVIGLFGYVLPSVGYFSAVPGDLGDARFNSVILEHVFKWLAGQQQSLWSPRFFYPFKGVLAFSDNNFGSALPYIFLRFLGAGREVAFDGWFVAGNCLNYFSAYWIMRRFSFFNFGSAAGAFVFAFALPVLAQENHAQLLYRFAIPFAFAAVYELLSQRRVVVLWRVAVWVMIQLYCSIYLGVFLSYLLLATLAAFLIINRGKRFFPVLIGSICNESRTSVLWCCGLTALCACAVIWLFYNYHVVSVDYGFVRSKSEIVSMLPRLSSYLLADRVTLSSWLGRLVDSVPMRQEQQMFFGFGVWIIGAYGVVLAWRAKEHRELGQIAVISFIFLFLVTLDFDGGRISAYMLLTGIPGISSIRAVSRIVLVMLFPVALIIALASDNLFSRASLMNTGKRFIVIFGMIFLLTVESISYQAYNTSIEQWRGRENEVRERLPSDIPDNSILYVTMKALEPFYLTELDAMILAQDLRMPTLNGYSGNIPPGWSPAQPCASFLNRLNAYAIYQHLPLSAMEDYARRVVEIDFQHCSEDALATDNVIDSDQAKKIVLQVLDIKSGKNHLSAKVSVKNTSNKNFNTLSLIGHPVRLSWRFMPIPSTGNMTLQSGWDTRKDLIWSISPGDKREITLSTKLALPPGEYVLEISLVQEGIAWFHDIGMKTASAKFNVQ